MGIHDYVRVLRRHLVFLVATTLIGLATGATIALLTPASYQASAQLYVSVRADSDARASELSQGTRFAQQAVQSYVDIVGSSIVLDPVIETLNLPESVDSLATRVHATVPTASVVMTITATDPSPAQAARTANAVADSFTSVVSEQLEQSTADGISRVRVSTLESAQVPLSPVAPNVPLSLGLGGLVGLLLGVGVVVLREVLDTRIHEVTDVEQITGAPTLGSTMRDPDATRRPLVVGTVPGARSEAYRALRTSVQFLKIGNEPLVLTITSAGQGEGKSTTAANLALALAETGAHVALVDADLRRPRVADYFGVEGGAGLADALADRVAPSDVIQRWAQSTLFLLTAGTAPPNPAELLGSDAMGSLVAELRAAFDVVIIDAPPVLPVTDAAVVARLTNGCLLIAAAELTSRQRLASAKASLVAAGSHVLGTVVTMLPPTALDAGTYHGTASRKIR